LAVVIRLARKGSCHKPFYRITVADSRSAATGKFLQQIGHYDPNQNPPVMKVDEASALQWMRNGARPSDTVKSLFHRHGLMEKSRLIEKGKATGETPVKLRAVGPKKLKVHKKVKEAQAAAVKEAQATAVKEAQVAATAKAAADKAEEDAKAAVPAE
jgi:small subunit ribosomal protein S16